MNKTTKKIICAISASFLFISTFPRCAAQNLSRILGGPYYSHLFVDKITAGSNVIIPSQSIFDVDIAARLGFKVIEGNVHATATPGKYIVMHGVKGTLGDEVTDLAGKPHADAVIDEISFKEIESNYVYRSKYAKYRTRISSLEEFLLECRRTGLIPMIQYVDSKEMGIVKSIMGNDFIMYWGTRKDSDGPILEYQTFKTIRQIAERCDYIGAPYLYCMGNVSDFTDEQLRTIIGEVHKRNCHIGFAGSYESPVTSQKLLGMGFDFSASGWDINEIQAGNLCNLAADSDFRDFRTEGKSKDGILSMESGQTLAPRGKIPCVFLGGGSLHIRFKGTVSLTMGNYIHHKYDSEGNHSLWISTYFMEQVPTFRLKAEGHTEIYEITYKASKM